MRLLALITFLLFFILLAFSLPARAYHHHGLICGATQMAHFGIRDPRYRLARSWLSFPHTTPHVGAVVFNWRNGRDSAGHRGGHVARIVAMNSCANAVVTDEAGTYSKNVCGLTAVQP